VNGQRKSTLRIKGAMHSHATTFKCSSTGHYILRVLVNQARCDLPYLAEQDMGSGPAAGFAAQRAAWAMRKGREVTLHGCDLKPRRFQGQQCLQLQSVELIAHDEHPAVSEQPEGLDAHAASTAAA
jgi:hypothetical protein